MRNITFPSILCLRSHTRCFSIGRQLIVTELMDRLASRPISSVSTLTSQESQGREIKRASEQQRWMCVAGSKMGAVRELFLSSTTLGISAYPMDFSPAWNGCRIFKGNWEAFSGRKAVVADRVWKQSKGICSGLNVNIHLS